MTYGGSRVSTSAPTVGGHHDSQRVLKESAMMGLSSCCLVVAVAGRVSTRRGVSRRVCVQPITLTSPLKLFYGSQTGTARCAGGPAKFDCVFSPASAPFAKPVPQPPGTAQWFAELLKKELKKKDIKATVVSLEDFDPVRGTSKRRWAAATDEVGRPQLVTVPSQP